MKIRTGSALAGALVLFGSASAATSYNEATNGDLSNNGLTPTALSFSAGSNTVTGVTGRDSGNVVDRDYFSFSIPVGQKLDAVTVLAGTTAIGPLGQSFIGIESGSQFTLATNVTSAAGLLGWWHYTAADVGTDILDDIAVPVNGASGFTTLGAGTYSVWVQDTASGTANYGLNFQISPVPEASSAATLLAGLAGLVAWRRRRSSAR